MPKKGGSLAATPVPNKITLSNGQEYELKPINMNILAEVEDKFDTPLTDLFGCGKIKPFRFLLHLQLKDKYPEMTEEQLGELVDLKTFTELRKSFGV